MARGGKRAGSGRKVGSATKRTREIADKAAAEGITPLEVMLGAMTELWAKGQKQEAAAVAKDAAPYCHPRLTAIEHSGKDGGPIQTAHIDLSKLSVDELRQLNELVARAAKKAA